MHTVKNAFRILVVLLLSAILWTQYHENKVRGQITQTGPVPLQYGSSLPGTGFQACTSSIDGVPYFQTGVNDFWLCTSGTWTSPVLGVPYFLNGTIQPTAKCDIVTGTTSGAGTATINISGMGFTTLLGIPQTQITNSSIGSIVVTAASATSVSILAQGTTVISLLGSNVTLFSNAALPYSITICGV